MQNEKLILSTGKKLKTNFFIWFLILLVLGGICFTTNLPFPRLNNMLAINLQQLLILCLLGGIPGVLVWSRKKMKMLVQVGNVSDRLKLYEEYVYIRQSVFFILGLFILFMHAFTTMKSALMLFFVVVCLCMFIIPTRGRLETEAYLTEPEN